MTLKWWKSFMKGIFLFRFPYCNKIGAG